MTRDRGTIKDTYFLDYIENLKVGEMMIAKTKINGKLRNYVVVRIGN